LVQLLLRRGANVSQSNLRGKTPVDVAATDVIARLLRGEDAVHRNHSAASSDDSDESRSPSTGATSPGSGGGCVSPRLTPGNDTSLSQTFSFILWLLDTHYHHHHVRVAGERF